MSDTDLDIKQLRAFISVATEQSFTGAAKALNCTQGTISSRIRALENQLGVRLFDRARFNIRMTPAGSDLFGGAQALLERHDQLFGHAHSKNVSGAVNLGIAEGFGSPLLTRLLRRIRDNYTALSITVSCGMSWTLQRMVDEGSLDLALVALIDEVPGATILSRPRLQWVGSGDFEFDGSSPLPIASYAEECPFRNSIIAKLEEAGVSFNEVLRGVSEQVIVSAVRAGWALTVMPENLVPGDLKVFVRPSLLPTLGRARVQLLETPGPEAEGVREIAREIANAYRGR